MRSVVSMGFNLDATLSLLDKYMSERYGGLDSHIAADFTRDVLQKSQPTNLRKIFSTQSTVTASMRCVLTKTKMIEEYTSRSVWVREI